MVVAKGRLFIIYLAVYFYLAIRLFCSTFVSFYIRINTI